MEAIKKFDYKYALSNLEVLYSMNGNLIRK